MQLGTGGPAGAEGSWLWLLNATAGSSGAALEGAAGCAQNPPPLYTKHGQDTTPGLQLRADGDKRVSGLFIGGCSGLAAPFQVGH